MVAAAQRKADGNGKQCMRCKYEVLRQHKRDAACGNSCNAGRQIGDGLAVKRDGGSGDGGAKQRGKQHGKPRAEQSDDEKCRSGTADKYLSLAKHECKDDAKHRHDGGNADGNGGVDPGDTDIEGQRAQRDRADQ